MNKSKIKIYVRTKNFGIRYFTRPRYWYMYKMKAICKEFTYIKKRYF